jgi:hypothetical protein
MRTEISNLSKEEISKDRKNLHSRYVGRGRPSHPLPQCPLLPYAPVLALTVSTNEDEVEVRLRKEQVHLEQTDLTTLIHSNVFQEEKYQCPLFPGWTNPAGYFSSFFLSQLKQTNWQQYSLFPLIAFRKIRTS